MFPLKNKKPKPQRQICLRGVDKVRTVPPERLTHSYANFRSISYAWAVPRSRRLRLSPNGGSLCSSKSSGRVPMIIYYHKVLRLSTPHAKIYKNKCKRVCELLRFAHGVVQSKRIKKGLSQMQILERLRQLFFYALKRKYRR